MKQGFFTRGRKSCTVANLGQGGSGRKVEVQSAGRCCPRKLQRREGKESVSIEASDRTWPTKKKRGGEEWGGKKSNGTRTADGINPSVNLPRSNVGSVLVPEQRNIEAPCGTRGPGLKGESPRAKKRGESVKRCSESGLAPSSCAMTILIRNESK